MAIRFLSSENVEGHIDINYSQNGITYLAVTNTNSGAAANARIQAVGESSQLDIIASSAGYTGVTGWADSGIISTDSGASGGLKLNAQAGGLSFQIGTSTAMFVDTNSKVGIGETSPESNLTVKGVYGTPPTSGTTATSIARIGTGGPTLDIGVVGSSPYASWLQATDKDSLGTTYAMSLQPIGGNVGIGTTNPLSKLTVSEGTNQHGVEIAPGTLSYIQAYDRATSTYGNLTIDAKYIAFGLDNGTEKIRFTASGNVGIGTSTPDELLHINKAVSAGSDNLLLRIQNPTTATDARVGIAFSVNDHTGTNWDGAYIQAENDGIAQADLTFGSAVNNSLSQHMIIEGNTGNVGIGTSTTIEGRVDVKMNMASINWTEGNWSEVWDSAGTPGTYFDDAVFHIDTERAGGATGGIVGLAFSPGWQGHQNWGIYSFNTGGGSYSSGDLAFVNQIDNGTITERMRITSGGALLVGTTSPQAGTKLQVAGVVDVWNSTNTLLRFQHDGTRGIIETFTSGAYSNTVINPNDGNVGIGTSAPQELLHLYKIADIKQEIESLTENAYLIINSGADGVGDSNREEGFIKFYQANNDFWSLGKRNNGYFSLYDHTAAKYVMQFGDNGAFELTPANNITTITGSVGIGTTLPSNKLHIAETTNVDAILSLNANSSALGISYMWNLVGASSSSNYSFQIREASTTYLSIRNSAGGSAGALQLNSYGSGTFTGTATYKLSVDASGNVIETAIGAGAVDGSGTAGTITKWTDSDTIGDSPITISGSDATFAGSITVGTGNSLIDGDLYFGVNADIFKNSGNLTLDVAGNIILDADGGFVAIKDGGTEIGNFGNSSSNFAITSSVQDKDILFQGNDNGSVITALTLDMSDGGWATFNSGIHVANTFSPSTFGKATFAGDVGINTTTSPAKNLVVEGNALQYATIRVLSNSTGHGSEIEFGDSTDADYGSITQFASSSGEGGRMRFRAGATETMNLSNGNVGIGVTVPSSVLHIKDNTANATQLSIQSNDFSRAEEINFLNPSTSAISGQIKYYTNPTVEYMSFSTSNNSAATERMRITAAGNVGIGNTSPSSLLTVGTSSNTEITIGDASGNAQGRLRFLTSNNQKNFQIGFNYNIAGGLEFTRSTAAGGSTFSTPDVAIANTGNVGIGTTSPDEKLQVKGNICINSESTSTATTDIDKIIFKKAHALGPGTALYTLGEIRSFTTGGYTGGLDFYYGKNTGGGSYASTFGMRLSDEGNLGIGDSAPNTKLEVNGDTTIRREGSESAGELLLGGTTDGGFVDFDGTSLQLNTQRDPNTGTFINTSKSQAGITLTGASADSYIKFYTNDANNATANERMRITKTGSVGIGTTAPTKKLTVDAGSTSGDGINITGSSSPGIFINETSGTVNSHFQNDGAASYLGTTTSHNLILRTAATTRFEISSAGKCAINHALSNRTLVIGGALDVQGTLYKTSGSFAIDHPLESKKDTHKLIHSFIEGPKADNIYRGKAQLKDGSVVVNLDTVSEMTEGTFVLLNRDVQCFTSNESDWDPVKGTIEGNLLTISCKNTSSNAMISWMVVGERQDKEIKESELTDDNGKVIVEPTIEEFEK